MKKLTEKIKKFLEEKSIPHFVIEEIDAIFLFKKPFFPLNITTYIILCDCINNSISIMITNIYHYDIINEKILQTVNELNMNFNRIKFFVNNNGYLQAISDTLRYSENFHNELYELIFKCKDCIEEKVVLKIKEL